MSKKTILFLVLSFFFLSSHFVLASLTINEIMYDLSGADSTNGKSREWIEIYNPDSNAVSIDASTWRIYDGSANRTINNQVNFSISAGSYVIFSGNKDTFLIDHPGFLGVVYDTGITSLSNTGATLKILDQSGNTVDTVSYISSQGGAGDGNSLQKISSSWIGAMSTPGTKNEISNTSTTKPTGMGGLVENSYGSGSDNSQNTNIASKETQSKNKVPDTKEIKTEITAKTLGFVGLPLTLQATTYGHSGEKLYFGKYFWNFGDGDSREISLSDSHPFTHTYFYPGEYVVSLDYSTDYYTDAPSASSQMTIKVIGADIVISRIGNEKDLFVELSNNTDYNADMGNWFLVGNTKSFNIPRNTFIGAKKKIIISPKISNFSAEDINNLKLLTPDGEVVFDYGSLNNSPLEESPVGRGGNASTPSSTLATPEVGNSSEKISASENKNQNIKIVSAVVSPHSLVVSAIESDAIKSKNTNEIFIFIIFIIFIGISAVGVYFVRRKGVIPGHDSDFEILDE